MKYAFNCENTKIVNKKLIVRDKNSRHPRNKHKTIHIRDE